MNSEFLFIKMSSKHVQACIHTSTHRREKLKPLFTISVQSDVLEIRRKGEGGRGGGENHMGGKKKRKPRFLSLPTFGGGGWGGFFFFQFPAPCCDFDK